MGRPRKEKSQHENTEPKREHPLVNAFDKEQYWVNPCDGGYCLYDKKRECQRANAQYLGQFYISTNGNKYVFRNDYYTSISELIEAMDKYNATLPFSPEIYDPIYRKHYMIEMAAHDYLTSIGFKKVKNSVKYDSYSFSDFFGHGLCIIDVMTEFDKANGTIRRKIVSTEKEESWQEAPFVDLESAIGAINSIVASYLAVVQAQLVNSLKAMTATRAALFLTKTFNVSTLSTFTENATQQTIELLESELKRLKGE